MKKYVVSCVWVKYTIEGIKLKNTLTLIKANNAAEAEGYEIRSVMSNNNEYSLYMVASIEIKEENKL